MERGEIWLVSLDPTAGHEQQERNGADCHTGGL